ncbi:hypothetical protein M413DRAFT_20168 [Hebeloma cylindrosporum]|uniref:DUF202 domain-containing protein n=1 Tax=Hebeloma cylindrosporum TaxID=76867 RepID=A0A0C2XJ94_HEBCY|nr:hypothetical protein M413DRAFT_20168 [Hebeloma cylindrosporum h7]
MFPNKRLENLSPSDPIESTPLLAGASSNPSRSKESSPRVFTAWTNTLQNRIRGKAHPIKHLQSTSHERAMGPQDHSDSNSGQVSPPYRRLSGARPSSPVTIDSLDDIHPGPTDNKHRPTAPLSFGPFPPTQPLSLCLQNSGSVARDHLASERTFLAYVRTSLAIVSAGVALVQLFSAASSRNPEAHWLHGYIRPLGATTVMVGLSVLLIGVTRYFMVQSALTNGYFPVARLAIGFIAIVLSALVTLTFGILLAGKVEGRE